MSVAVGLDIGTTSISAASVSRDGGVTAVSRSNDASVGGRPAGCAEQNPRRLREIAIEVLRELASRLTESPHCLGLTGQMHGGLLVDARRRPLSNLITWQDRRATQVSPTGRTWLEEFRERCPTGGFEGTGCQPSAGYLAVTLFTLIGQGEMPSGAAIAACAADWIAAELCGGPIVTDPTHAASTGAFDVRDGTWSHELIEAGELDAALFPRVSPSGEPIGRLRRDIARAVGLPEGLPVCNSVGDNQAAFLGCVPFGDPSVNINVGTGGQISWPVADFVRAAGMDTRPLPPDRFLLVGAGLVGGDAYAWMGRTVAKWLAEFGGAVDAEAIFAHFDELAEAAPEDCGGLRCEPLFRGTRQRPDVRGTFAGVDAENFTPGNAARAVLTGIAEGFRSLWMEAGESRPTRFERIIGSGNGLRKNPLLARIIARTFGKEVWLPRHREEAAVGAAILAGGRTGFRRGLADAERQIRLERAAAPSFR
ncbi:MAG: FGGY family carbohydrate kinase [Planctomycetales bacterium]